MQKSGQLEGYRPQILRGVSTLARMSASLRPPPCRPSADFIENHRFGNHLVRVLLTLSRYCPGAAADVFFFQVLAVKEKFHRCPASQNHQIQFGEVDLPAPLRPTMLTISLPIVKLTLVRVHWPLVVAEAQALDFQQRLGCGLEGRAAARPLNQACSFAVSASSSTTESM